MARTIKTKSGVKIVLRNPAEKATRYAWQLKYDQVAETGQSLSATDRSFRIGYLTARKDSANAFKAKHPLKYPKTKKRNYRKNVKKR